MSEITPKQLEANRRNSKLGGVKTTEGKAISRLNAIRHNVLGAVMTDEEAKDAIVIQTRFTKEFDPQSTIEEILIERMSIWYVRIQRAVKAEAEQMKKIHDPEIVKGGLELEDFGKTVVHQGYQPKVAQEHIDALEKTYLRYEGLLERNFYKALHELQRVQAVRRGDVVPHSLAVDVDIEDGK